MKAAHVFLFVLLIALAACSAAVSPAVTAVRAAAPTQAAAPSATTIPTPGPAVVSASAAVQAAPTSFSIGVPAGDAYAPMSAVVDSARNLAYVYHADSVERRPVISVVDLVAGQVARLIRLDRTTPGAAGRLFLTPDGKRLFLQESQDFTVLTIDTVTGRLQKLLEGVRDAVLAEDGRVLYAVQGESVAAYSPSSLLLGNTQPIWQAPGQYARVALNGERLLVARYGNAGSLAALDALTGKEVARGDTPETADALAAGPGGGWAVVVSGERPRLIRYDAGLKNKGETPIVYTGALTYDAARNRYLVGGMRYGEAEPVGRQVILSVDAGDGRLLDEVTSSGAYPPSVFAAWRQDAFVAFAPAGSGDLSILDASTLAARSDIPTGARAESVVVDGISRLYVADDLGRIHVLQLPDGKEVAVWQGTGPLVLDKANQRLYANRGGRVVAYSLRDGSLVAQFPQRGYPAPDSQADLVYIADRGVTIYDRSGKKLGTLPSTFPVEKGFSPNPYAYAAQVNPVTGHVAVVMSNGIPGSNGGSFLRVYPRQSDKAVEPPAPHSFVMDLTSDRRGNWYVAYSPARTQEAIQVLSAEGKQLDRLDHRTGYMALDPDKDELYLFGDGRVTRLTASTLTAEQSYEGPEYVSTLDYSPSSRTAYLTGSSTPLVTPVDVDALQAPDLRPVPGRPAPDAYNEGLSIVGTGRERVLLARFGETYRTSDGETWQRLLPGLEMIFGYTTAAAPRTVFLTGRTAGGNEGVWRSTDGGDKWEWLTGGLADLQPSGPVLANSADEAYFLNRGQGLLRWDPTRRVWQTASPAPAEDDWSHVSLAPDGALFRSAGGNLERSTDRGASWEKLGKTDKTGDVIGFSALYTTTHTLFSAVRSDYRVVGINRSTDGGKTWKPSLSGAAFEFDGYPLAMASGFGKTYLLTRPYNGPVSLLRTSDLGESWQAATQDAVAEVQNLAVDPVDGRLWLGMKGGVRSLDPEKLAWSAVSVQPARSPVPTPVPSPTAGPCTRTLTGGDAEINARNLGLGCPKGITKVIPMARQRFHNGQMLWRQDTRQIYVLYNDGRWNVYDDKWLEGDPVDDPKIVVPPGVQQPGRGFGKVWREQLGGPKAALGWALEKEQGVEGQATDWEHGIVLRFGGEAFVLLEGGDWR